MEMLGLFSPVSTREKCKFLIPMEFEEVDLEDTDVFTMEEFIEAVADLRRKCALPENFKKWDLSSADFPFVVKNCRSGSMKSNPRDFSDEEVCSLLEKLI